MATHDHLPGGGQAADRRPRRNKARKGRVVALVAAGALVAGAAIAVPFALNAQQPAPSESVAVPSPAPKFTKQAGVNYYKQPGPQATATRPVAPMTVNVSASELGTSIDAGAVGLSLEATDLADPSLSSANADLVATLKGLGKPLLRFGGNAVDRRFFWTSSGEAMPGDRQGDKAHPARTVTPKDLERVKTLVDAIDGTVNLTVDLGHYDPARAADMSRHAARIFGKRLVGLTIGNEPNGYPNNGLRPGSWGISDYLNELKTYADAINSAAPGVPIIGPGTYSEAWWKAFASTPLPQQRIMSFHYYPLSSCSGSEPGDQPTLANLMSDYMHPRVRDYDRRAMQPATAAGLETWLTETGPSACPGSNPTTKNHASALWYSEFALNGLQQGIKRLGFHSSLITCVGGPPLSPICSGGKYLQPDGAIEENPSYFGLAMVSDMGTGKFLKLEQSGGGLSYAYAVKHADGSTSVYIANKNDPQKDGQATVTLSLPGKPKAGTMTQMAGPGYTAAGATVIDGKKALPVADSKRPMVMDFVEGSSVQKFPLTSGTITVLHFTY